MTCADYKRWLSSHVDGLLEAGQRAELERHLAACAACTKELSSLRTMLASLRTMGAVKAPKEFLSGVHAKLAQPAAAPGWSWSGIRLPEHGLGVGLAALLVVMAVAVPKAMRSRALAPDAVPADQPAQELAPDKERAARMQASEGWDALADKSAGVKLKEESELDRDEWGADFRRNAAEPDRDKAAAASDELKPASAPMQSISAGRGGYRGLEKQDAKVASAPELRWSVMDREASLAALRSWVGTIPGASIEDAGDRVIVRIPQHRYPDLQQLLAREVGQIDASALTSHGAREAQLAGAAGPATLLLTVEFLPEE